MHFAKIKITKDDEVELSRLDVHKHSKDAIETSGVNPLPSFVDAVKAFLPLFLRVVPQLEEAKDNLRVSTLTLGEKDGDRSLQISATLSVEACNGAGISMTTPRLTVPPEGAKEGQIYLGRNELQLIEHVEAEALRYYQGETAQGEMFSKTSANAKEFDDRAASAEVASTRRPRSGKKGLVSVEQLADDALRQLLMSVERDVPVDAIKQWSSSERDRATNWATMRQREIVGSLKDSEKMPAEPTCILKSATMPLSDGWTEAKPPKLDDAAISKVKSAADRGAARSNPHVQ